jgi:SsrA-binding protein
MASDREPGKKDEIRLVQKNRKAWFKYEILERLEAGLVLKGSEVKSIRAGQVSIHEAYARVKNGEGWVINMEVSAYRQAGPFNHEPKRPRKLLLKRSEIRKLIGRTREKGLTLVPLSLYFKNGYAKLELGLAKGKTLYDKRESIRRRESDRDLRRRTMKR